MLDGVHVVLDLEVEEAYIGLAFILELDQVGYGVSTEEDLVILLDHFDEDVWEFNEEAAGEDLKSGVTDEKLNEPFDEIVDVDEIVDADETEDMLKFLAGTPKCATTLSLR